MEHQVQATEARARHQAAGLQATVPEVPAGAAMAVEADTAEAEAAVAAARQAEGDKTT